MIRSLRWTLYILSLFVLVSLASCSSLTEKKDETVSWSAQKLYAEAKGNLNSGHYDQAVKLYEKITSRYPSSPYAQQAQMEIAYAYYKDQDSEQALAAADRYIKQYPSAQNVDYLYYLRGLINLHATDGFFNFFFKQDPTERDPKAAREAFNDFKQVVEKFPKGQYAHEARKKMFFLVNSMAQHDLNIAKYYYQRGAYLAAANRAQDVITKFRDTPANQDALVVMIRSYDRMGLIQLRDDTERVFKKTYPNSPMLRVKLVSDKPWWLL